MDLDFFVMFSSMVALLGAPGLSSYSACNAFQDSLAQYRRHVLGLPGLSINWGAISGAGLMERETRTAKLMTLAGLGFIHAKEGRLNLFTEKKNNKEIDNTLEFKIYFLYPTLN